MTRVTLSLSDGHIVAVEAKGHTGYADSGSDIICAAVSSVIQTALLGLKELCQFKTESVIRDGYIKFSVSPASEKDYIMSDAILGTMRLGIEDLAGGYPKHIILEES